MTFKSCGSTEWGALHKNYFTSQYGSDAEITCTQHLPDESTLVRVGTESYCMKNYCDTLQIDKQYSMGRTTGIKLPKTRGDFVAIASSQNICRQAVNDCTAIPLCEMEKRVISKNPSSIVFSPANGTEWNYTIDTDRGTINTTISVIGTSGLGLSAIES
ncbi:hypothetical protein PE067_19930 [Paracoccus sp. DMF-8]|uniref:hypothetical protein n=1 Tax=Paracoccus sp. DMF-8 TaxID=3019445 RepID=UPI0023E41D50|nr:hypothetical protein [Paracoccus sp. DMF-8]MDF3608210.1 hypothetical protein [Paracoccus sp. DMF-8]